VPLDSSRAPTSASPLWIIALFIALSEATAGAAAAITDGAARLIFACFAATFPVIVLFVFVWLLVKHAPKLYAPGQYSKEITPEIYRIGISRADSIFIGQAVAKTVVPLLGEGQGEDRDTAVARVAQRFADAVDESSIVVNLGVLKPGAKNLHIPVSSDTGIQSVLNEIYFALSPAVEPVTYDRFWVLIDDDNNEYSGMGMSWADEQDLEADPRTILEVGILPGSRLTAVPKKRSQRRKPTDHSPDLTPV
jgi:hypothetical protein